MWSLCFFFFFQAEDGIRDVAMTGVQTCALPILCQQKATSNAPASLVLGIADERAPQILDEVRCVSSLLPHSSLHLGEYATSSLLREKGPESGLLHIATHGVYRQDNPMFSGIRLGDGYLNLYDLYQMKLNARLVTLSGCATGMNFVAAGDELLGLQRGLFCAGATTLLLSLWDVHDESTAQLMGHFYRRYIEGHSMAESLQHAMRELRQTRSEEHTSELQSRLHLVCRLLLEKKNFT